jgi:tripartite-type tricarboxylate transporter receptor subunit TctC
MEGNAMTSRPGFEQTSRRVRFFDLPIGLVRGSMLGLMLGLLTAVASPARADDAYPARPIRLVVPYPPGAITDALCRIVATELGKVIGQSVIVENKPGGGTVIGTQAVRNAPADGYSLLFQLGGLVSNVYALKQPGYALADFTPISMLGQSAYVMILSSKHQFNTLQDLIAYGKKHPGELNYSLTGAGGAQAVMGSKIKQATGIDWSDIVYKGGAEATQAVMSGDVHFSLPTQGAPLIHVNRDRLRFAAVTSEKRLEFLPEVPTFKELGYPSIVEQTWFGMFVRSQVSQPAIDKLKSAMAEVMSSPAMQQHLKDLRISPYEGALDDVPAKMQRELTEFTQEAKKLGIEPQ